MPPMPALPPSHEALEADQAAALTKYRPLVRRLRHGDLFGLVKATNEELARRKAWGESQLGHPIRVGELNIIDTSRRDEFAEGYAAGRSRRR